MKIIGCLLALIGNLASWVHAYAPMHAPVALVAGEGSRGFVDGDFDKARFDGITSLVLDETQQLLYVADANNAAIRCIDLKKQNKVMTVASMDTLGKPGSLAFGQDTNSLYFIDLKTFSLKMLDIKTRRIVGVKSSYQEPGGRKTGGCQVFS
jgi:hypothetical protein